MTSYLTEYIRDGTFPESNELLSAETSPDGTSSLLTRIAESKNQLKAEIKDVSQNVAGDVDEWIAQAKKLQDDIARCKIEARSIVQEHERGEVLRNEVKDTNNKVQLLENEIGFTLALEHEIQSISEISQVLEEASNDLTSHNPVSAVGKLTSLKAAIDNISAKRTRSLLLQLEAELSEDARKNLEDLLASRWAVVPNGHNVTLVAHSNEEAQQASGKNSTSPTTDSVIEALGALQALSSTTKAISRTTESFILSTIITTTAPFPSAAIVQGESLVVTRSDDKRDPSKIIAILRTALQFVNDRLPAQIKGNVAQELLPKVVSGLVTGWLDPALPHDLSELYTIKPLQEDVIGLSRQLQDTSWPGAENLKDWVEQIPRGWLAKRRASSLDAVRKAFTSARGITRQVERVERQRVSSEQPQEKTADRDDEWNTDWDDETQNSGTKQKNEADDEDVSGWDFDTDDKKSDSAKNSEPAKNENEDDDTGDAWGWGDEDKADEKPDEPESTSQTKRERINGETNATVGVEEMVLKELYYITDIPDYILEIIGRDIADSHELQDSASKYFDNNSVAAGLASLSNLTLALFRAIAPTYYSLPSTAYTLSNMNLYNDILYITQRLIDSMDSTSLQPSIHSLTKFARQIYSSELDIQRTILTDLLDGAQGFDRCTTFPNSQACIDAVSSTIDRLRQLHKDWSTILGESHLFQSLGSLITMVFSKIIKDIEDMDDISEAESKQLVTFCQQVLGLEDLFSHVASGTNLGSEDQQPSSQILLYVPNYLRFQYLQQILDSNLVDIKYLWTEGELSLEFSVDEVEDLVKALFAESQHRRNAIRTIRGSVVG